MAIRFWSGFSRWQSVKFHPSVQIPTFECKNGQPFNLFTTHAGAFLEKVPIHTRLEPDRPCGFARRIGYTGNQADAFAIYRLRVLFHTRTVMLPGLFMVQEGFFVRYGDEQKQDEDLREQVLESIREAVQEEVW